MPHISVKMYPGRNLEVKEDFAKKLHKFAVEQLGCKDGHVSVSIEDIAQEDWQKQVVEQIKPEDLIIEPNF